MNIYIPKYYIRYFDKYKSKYKNFLIVLKIYTPQAFGNYFLDYKI